MNKISPYKAIKFIDVYTKELNKVLISLTLKNFQEKYKDIEILDKKIETLFKEYSGNEGLKEYTSIAYSPKIRIFNGGNYYTNQDDFIEFKADIKQRIEALIERKEVIRNFHVENKFINFVRNNIIAGILSTLGATLIIFLISKYVTYNKETNIPNDSKLEIKKEDSKTEENIIVSNKSNFRTFDTLGNNLYRILYKGDTLGYIRLAPQGKEIPEGAYFNIFFQNKLKKGQDSGGYLLLEELEKNVFLDSLGKCVNYTRETNNFLLLTIDYKTPSGTKHLQNSLRYGKDTETKKSLGIKRVWYNDSPDATAFEKNGVEIKGLLDFDK